jgi:hypothetical protein
MCSNRDKYAETNYAVQDERGNCRLDVALSSGLGNRKPHRTDERPRSNDGQALRHRPKPAPQNHKNKAPNRGLPPPVRAESVDSPLSPPSGDGGYNQRSEGVNSPLSSPAGDGENLIPATPKALIPGVVMPCASRSPGIPHDVWGVQERESPCVLIQENTFLSKKVFNLPTELTGRCRRDRTALLHCPRICHLVSKTPRPQSQLTGPSILKRE